MRCFDWYVCSICLFESTFVSIYLPSVAILAALRVALPCYFSFVFGCWRTNHVLIKVKISYDKLTHLKSYGGTIFGCFNTHTYTCTYIYFNRVHLSESSFGQRLSFVRGKERPIDLLNVSFHNSLYSLLFSRMNGIK